ncbi:murein L,D-transpeptidase catalytic domain family protein [Ohtaekwangia sp.]|uniref:murein L,D-transpeptidase catalytic domain family protein n=1 Tax=Ohtaekwangia sp. TaxID=2066019 RepID=UPI002F92F0B4
MTFLMYWLLAFYTTSPTPTTTSARHSNHVTVVADSVDRENISAINLEDSLHHLYEQIGLERYHLSYEAFRYGIIGYYTLRMQGKLSEKNILSIIDFTKSSREKRFYTIDLDKRTIEFYTHVSHGKNTGEDLAKSFSNIPHSNQSSLGFYITAETYIGSKGYSLKLDGQDKGYNDKIRDRAVVMHAADYVSEYWINRYGRLGRSQGCPALSNAIAREVIDAIKGRTAIFAYYNDPAYLASSLYLNVNQLLDNMSMMARHEE